MSAVTDHKDVQKYLGRKVIPIMPFLVVKALMSGDKVAEAKIGAIFTGLIPNTPHWCAKFGTNPLHVTDKAISGRWLFATEQGSKEV